MTSSPYRILARLELLKLAALMGRPDGQSVAESLHDVNSRILQAVTAEQREIFQTSSLDEYLLDSERDARARAAAVAARDEPTLKPFLPLRILNLLPLSHLFGQSLALLIPPVFLLLPEWPSDIGEKPFGADANHPDEVRARTNPRTASGSIELRTSNTNPWL